MPYVLGDRNYDQLRRHMQQVDQELVNVKNKISGSSRRWARGGSSLAPLYTQFYNDSGEAAPSHAAMRITGADTRGYVTISKPNTTFQALYLINCGKEVPYEGKGYGSFIITDTPCWNDRLVLYNNANTPAAGECWGVTPSTWVIAKNGPGFAILGGYDGASVAAIQIPPGQILVYNDSGGAIAAAGSGTVSVYGGAAGSESDSGFNISVYNRSSVSWPSNKFGFAEIVNGQAYVSPHQT